MQRPRCEVEIPPPSLEPAPRPPGGRQEPRENVPRTPPPVLRFRQGTRGALRPGTRCPGDESRVDGCALSGHNDLGRGRTATFRSAAGGVSYAVLLRRPRAPSRSDGPSCPRGRPAADYPPLLARGCPSGLAESAAAVKYLSPPRWKENVVFHFNGSERLADGERVRSGTR